MLGFKMENINRETNLHKVCISGCDEMFPQVTVVVVEYIGRTNTWKLQWKGCLQEVLYTRNQ